MEYFELFSDKEQTRKRDTLLEEMIKDQNDRIEGVIVIKLARRHIRNNRRRRGERGERNGIVGRRRRMTRESVRRRSVLVARRRA